MRKEYLDILSKCDKIELSVNYKASFGIEADGSIYPDCIVYYIRDNNLTTWNDDIIESLADMDDSSWGEDVTVAEGMADESWFECMMTNIIMNIYEEGLEGEWALGYWLDSDITIEVLLKDEDDNIVEKIEKLVLSDFL